MAVDGVRGAVPDEYLYSASTRVPNKDLDKNAFLQLFILSLKTQDPTSPQDANEFMSQMAQFSILEQLSNLNVEMSKLKLSQELEQASSLIGRQVKVVVADLEMEGLVEKVTAYQGNVKVYLKDNPAGYDLENVKEVV